MSEDRDAELERLLAEAKQIRPTEYQTAKWESATQRELSKARFLAPQQRTWIGQIAAALIVGFFLGAVSYRQFENGSKASEPVATIQYVFANTE